MPMRENLNIFIDEIFSRDLDKNYKTDSTMFKAIDDFWSRDIIGISSYGSGIIRGVRDNLVVIDIFSKCD